MKKKINLGIESKKHVFALVGLFLFLGFALSFMAVPQDVSITGKQTDEFDEFDERGGSTVKSSVDPINDIKNFFGSIFGSLSNVLLGGSNTFDATFLKWSFFLILSILFFSIFSVIQWPGTRFVMWILAIPLAFITVTLINSADIITSIQGYGALGLAFVSVLPIAIMILFSSQLLQPPVTSGKILFQLILWWYFLAYTFYFFISYAIANYGKETLSWPVLLITLSPVVIVAFFTFSNKWFRTWVRQLGRELITEVGSDVAAARASFIPQHRNS